MARQHTIGLLGSRRHNAILASSHGGGDAAVRQEGDAFTALS
jgi:hypothetical protein